MSEVFNGSWAVEYPNDSGYSGQSRIEITNGVLIKASCDIFKNNQYYGWWESTEEDLDSSRLNIKYHMLTKNEQEYSGQLFLDAINNDTLEGKAIEAGKGEEQIRYRRLSDAYRTLTVEVDRTIDKPALPSVNHQGRVWSLASIYGEAGLALTINEGQANIPDITDGFTNAELHRVMLDNRESGINPQNWYGYMFLTSKMKDRPSVFGVMYDHGGPSVDTNYIPREGCAIFIDAFSRFPTADQRNLLILRTAAHELGHALNMLHPKDEDRPLGTTIMNQTGDIFALADEGEFPSNVSLLFEYYNIQHLRHHPHPAVTFGGDDFRGDVLDLSTHEPMVGRDDSRLELTIVLEKQRVCFLEPVFMTVRIKNVSNEDIIIDDQIKPDAGILQIWAITPSMRIRRFRPIVRVCSDVRPFRLTPAQVIGTTVTLHLDADGVVFRDPGQYKLFAQYTGILSSLGRKVRSIGADIQVSYPSSAKTEDTLDKLSLSGPIMFFELGGADHLRNSADVLATIDSIQSDIAGQPELNAYLDFIEARRLSVDFNDVINDTRRDKAPADAEVLLNGIDPSLIGPSFQAKLSALRDIL